MLNKKNKIHNVANNNIPTKYATDYNIHLRGIK
jgi:hypothetical protein